MTLAKLRSIDLNLVPVLRELLRTRNVTRAAEALNMSQSAVSEALKRLRHQFHDEILVRAGRSMVPTQLAESLAPKVEEAVGELEHVFSPQHFCPADIDRQFVIATADNIILEIGGELVARLARDAPNATIQVVDLQSVDVRALEKGDLDFIILPERPDPQDLRSFMVFEEEFVCIARRNHPKIKGSLSQEELEAMTSVAFRPDSKSSLVGSPHVDSKDQIRIPHFMLLPFLVEQSDAVAILQKHVADRFVKMLDIEIIDAPVHIPGKVQVHAYWARIHENDPAHRWLRSVLRDIADRIHRRGLNATCPGRDSVPPTQPR